MKVLRDPIEQVIKYTVTLPTGCWNWVGPERVDGYGQITVDGTKKVLAHRWVYERLRDKIPDGFQIDHLCTNRACVNPQHLEPVTARENSRRGHVDWRKYLEECVKGHPLSGDNLRVGKTGKRICISCARAAQRRHRAKLKAAGK